MLLPHWVSVVWIKVGGDLLADTIMYPIYALPYTRAHTHPGGLCVLRPSTHLDVPTMPASVQLSSGSARLPGLITG